MPSCAGGRFALLVVLARRPRWLAGTALMVVAWPLQVLALALAPITVVQPALASTQLVLLVIARSRLRERVGRIEVLGALAIVIGVTAVVLGAPAHTNRDPAAGRVLGPLALVGAGALVTYLIGRARLRLGLAVVLGAGLAYSWVDFVNKLLADDISAGRWVLAAVWLAATVAVGTLALLEEQSALQVRPAVTVAPVVGAVQNSLPVLMALWAGVEVWGSAAHRVLVLVIGLALVTAGAVLLGRSRAVVALTRGGPLA